MPASPSSTSNKSGNTNSAFGCAIFVFILVAVAMSLGQRNADRVDSANSISVSDQPKTVSNVGVYEKDFHDCTPAEAMLRLDNADASEVNEYEKIYSKLLAMYPECRGMQIADMTQVAFEKCEKYGKPLKRKEILKAMLGLTTDKKGRALISFKESIAAWLTLYVQQ